MSIRKGCISATCVSLLLSTTAQSVPSAGIFGLGGLFGKHNLAMVEPLFGKNESRCFNRPDRLLVLLETPAPKDQPEFDNRDRIYSADGGSGKANDRADKCNAIVGRFRYQLTVPYALAKDGRPASLPEPPGTIGRYGTTANYSERNRNEIVDAIIAVSNQKCATYSAFIKNTDGALNGALSIGAIVSGSIGPIAGGEATAKALSATSAIFSGTRAAINETFLTNQAIHILVAAYEQVRSKIREEITAREACPPGAYSVMRGIEDAQRYHDSCSLVVGLAETSKAVERASNPGVKDMIDSMKQFALLQKAIASAGDTAADTLATPKTDAPQPSARPTSTTTGQPTEVTTAAAPSAMVADSARVTPQEMVDADDAVANAESAAKLAATNLEASLRKYQAATSKDKAGLQAALAKASVEADTATKTLARTQKTQARLKLIYKAADTKTGVATKTPQCPFTEI